MNYIEMQNIATKHNLGTVYFEERVDLNTGKTMEVGYVYVNNYKELFCKKPSYKQNFYLCNQFCELT